MSAIAPDLWDQSQDFLDDRKALYQLSLILNPWQKDPRLTTPSESFDWLDEQPPSGLGSGFQSSVCCGPVSAEKCTSRQPFPVGDFTYIA